LKIKNRQQLLLIGAAALVGLFAADALLLTPLSKTWKARSARVKELRQQVSEGRNLVAREQVLRSRWEEMRTNTLPNNLSVAEQKVLQAFDRWSQESRISILSISPQRKKDSDDYMTVECRVEASGNLNTVSRFLYDLEHDPMALRIQMLEVSSRDNDGQQLALGLQVSGLVLTPSERAVATAKR
jgi:hypothetical protein